MQHIQRSILLLICLTVLFASFVAAQEKQSGNLFVVTVNGKQGYIDKTGKILIQPQFHGASEFSEGLAIVGTFENYKAGYINKTGKFVIAPQFDNAQDFSEGLAAVGFGEYGMHDGGEHKTGFIDKTGKIVIETKFRDAWLFSEGLAVVKDKGKFGFVDKTGKVVIPLIYDAAFEFSEGLAVIKLNGKYGYTDKTGKIVIEPRYFEARSFSEGLASVKTKETVDANGYERIAQDEDNAFYNYIDKRGRIVLSDFNSASSFSNGLARTYKNGNDEVINKMGKVVFKSELSILEFDFSEGLAKVMLVNGKLDKINKTKKTLSFADLLKLDPPGTQYELGFINKNEKIIFRTKFKQLDNFKNGLAQFCEDYKVNAKCGYINKAGKVIWQPTN